MVTLQLEEAKDRKIGIYSSGLVIAVLLMGLYFTTFMVNPPLPIDVPPLKSDEVIKEFHIDNIKLVEEAGGSGGGTPSNAKVDVPKPQSEKIVTSNKGETKVFSGNSNHQTANNSNNSTTTTQKGNNPFGTGGDGGESGSGSGGRFGNDQGTGGPGPGGNGSGAGRVRINNLNVDNIETNVNVTLYLRLTINSEGEVVSVKSLPKTTTTDQRIINQVISEVKKQVRYSKDSGSGLVTQDYTVRINAT